MTIQGLYLVVDRAGRDKEKSLGLHALYILSLSAAVHNMTFLKGWCAVYSLTYITPSLCMTLYSLHDTKVIFIEVVAIFNHYYTCGKLGQRVDWKPLPFGKGTGQLLC